MKHLKRFSFMLVIMLVLSMMIIPAPVDAATVKLNKSKITLEVGKTTTLKITGTKKKPTWKSSNKKVATVNGGKVTAKKKGTATIAATVGKKKYTCKVTVKSVDYSNWVSFRTNDFSLVRSGILTGEVIYKDGDDYLVSPDYYKNVIEPAIEIIESAESEYANPYGVPLVTVNPKTLFTDKSKITTSVGKKIKVVITLKTDLEDTVYAKITNDTYDNDRDDLLYFDEEEIATVKFGDWNGDRIPIYVTAKASGKSNLIIYSEITKEKIIIPIVIK